MKYMQKVMVSLVLCAVLLFSGVISAFATADGTVPVKTGKTAAGMTHKLYFDNNRAKWQNVYICYYDIEEWGAGTTKVQLEEEKDNVYSGKIPLTDSTAFYFTDGKNQLTEVETMYIVDEEYRIDYIYIIEPCIARTEGGVRTYPMGYIPLSDFSVGMKYTNMFIKLLSLAGSIVASSPVNSAEVGRDELVEAYESGLELYMVMEKATQEEIDAHTQELYIALIRLAQWYIWLGDVNYDALIDMQDVLMVQKHVAGLVVLDKGAKVMADVNGDKLVDMQDVLYIQKFIAGCFERFPIWESDTADMLNVSI